MLIILFFLFLILQQKILNSVVVKILIILLLNFMTMFATLWKMLFSWQSLPLVPNLQTYVFLPNFTLYSQSQIFYRLQYFLAAIKLRFSHPNFLRMSRILIGGVAMQIEIDTLERNHTWHLTSLPSRKKVLGCKWVYKIDWYKARLVILGNKQVKGLDYHETFALVAKIVPVSNLLTVVASSTWKINQMDVHNMFLLGDLCKEVYMK